MPKGEIVGIKLSLPLVTTLIQFCVVIELIIQFLVSPERSSVNQVLQFTLSILEAADWIQEKWRSAVTTKLHSFYQAVS